MNDVLTKMASLGEDGAWVGPPRPLGWMRSNRHTAKRSETTTSTRSATACPTSTSECSQRPEGGPWRRSAPGAPGEASPWPSPMSPAWS